MTRRIAGTACGIAIRQRRSQERRVAWRGQIATTIGRRRELAKAEISAATSMTFAGGENKLRDEAESFKRNNKPGRAMQKARRRRRSSHAMPSARWQRQHAGRRQAARQRRYLLRRMAEWLAASTAEDAGPKRCRACQMARGRNNFLLDDAGRHVPWDRGFGKTPRARVYN